MPGTFSQIYIQIVFAVKGRQNFLKPSFEEEVYKYISGIVSAKEQKSLAVNGMPIMCIFWLDLSQPCVYRILCGILKTIPPIL